MLEASGTLTALLAAELAAKAANDKYKLPTHYCVRTECDDTRIMIKWGPSDRRPNGFYALKFAADAIIGQDQLDLIGRDIDRIAFMAALIVGRDQELRNLCFDPANPPIWARAGTPMLKLLIERILARGEDLDVEDIGAVLHPHRFVPLGNDVHYFCNWWHDVEGFALPSPKNEAMRSAIVGTPLHDIVDNGGKIAFEPIIQVKSVVAWSRDLSLDDNGYSDFDDDHPEVWHVKARFSKLIRFAEPPIEEIERDPVKAWLDLAPTAELTPEPEQSNGPAFPFGIGDEAFYANSLPVSQGANYYSALFAKV